MGEDISSFDFLELWLSPGSDLGVMSPLSDSSLLGRKRSGPKSTWSSPSLMIVIHAFVLECSFGLSSFCESLPSSDFLLPALDLLSAFGLRLQACTR